MRVIQVLAVLCFAGASCMNPGTPLSPVIVAARDGDTVHMAELIAAGADVNQRGGVNNWTPLKHAVHKNQRDAVRVLIDAGADINATAGTRGRDTALRLATVQHHPNIAALLRAHGGKSPQ